MRPISVKILLALLVFIVSYAMFLAVWTKMRGFYGHNLDIVAASLTALSMDTKVEGVKHEKDKSVEKITMTKLVVTKRGLADLVFDQTVKTDNYAFNVPLTAALLTACLVFMRWPWYSLIEGIVLIVSGHLLYVYSYLMLSFEKALVNLGVMKYSYIKALFWEFMWAFSDNMVIRFEPFLIVVIIWLLHGQRNKDLFSR